MQTATCVMCQERVNLLTQKLVTAQWVDSRSGALLSLTFHSDCYVRWYQQTAQAAAATERTGSALAPQSGTSGAIVKRAAQTSPEPAKPAQNVDLPERHLSADELSRLQRLRGRRDTDQTAIVEPATEKADAAEDGSTPSGPQGTETGPENALSVPESAASETQLDAEKSGPKAPAARQERTMDAQASTQKKPKLAGDAGGAKSQEPNQADKDAPDDQQPEDRHDVPPPNV